MVDVIFSKHINKNIITVDVSKISKSALVRGTGMLKTGNTVIIYYNDMEKPAVEIDFSNLDAATTYYDQLIDRLSDWKNDEANQHLEHSLKELEILKEEKVILMQVFDKFKELMSVVDTEQIDYDNIKNM